MPMEPSEHLIKVLKEMGACVNRTKDEAQETLLEYMKEAQDVVEKALADGMPVSLIVSQAIDAYNAAVFSVKLMSKMHEVSGNGITHTDVSSMIRGAALVATSATALVRDMAFMGRRAPIDENGNIGRCEGCTSTDCPASPRRDDDGEQGESPESDPAS